MKYERLYEELFHNEKEKFSLMENTANALLLQFTEPIKYDLAIPGSKNISRLLNIFQENLSGNYIKPEDVNCIHPSYIDRRINFNFGDELSKKVDEGLNLCFGLKNKYDTFPLQLYLDWNNDVFGSEKWFYRFREGKRQEIEGKVKDYFNSEELLDFEKIGNFIQPYIKNLDKGVTID